MAGWTVVRDALLLLALAPLAYYALAIFAVRRFFRSLPRLFTRIRAPGQHSEADSRARSRDVRKLRQFLPPGLSGIRDSFLRDG